MSTTNKKEKIPEKKVWICHIGSNDLSAQGALSVGDRFLLECEGDDMLLSSQSLQLLLPYGLDHQLKLLSVESSRTGKVQLNVTSYVPGDHTLEGIILSDGVYEVAASPVVFSVASVLDTSIQARSGPFPSYSPVELSYPVFFWIVLVSIVFAFSLVGGWWSWSRWRLNSQNKKMLEALGMDPIVANLSSWTWLFRSSNWWRKNLRKWIRGQARVSAISRLFFDLRKISREVVARPEMPESYKQTKVLEHFENLDKIFRTYLMREFFFLALELSPRKLMGQLRVYRNRKTQKCIDEVYLLSKEVWRAKRNAKKLNFQDCERMTQWVRSLAEKIDKMSHQGQLSIRSRVDFK